MALSEATDGRDGHAIGNCGLVATAKERAAIRIDHIRQISEPLGKLVGDEVLPHLLNLGLALLGLGVALWISKQVRPHGKVQVGLPGTGEVAKEADRLFNLQHLVGWIKRVCLVEGGGIAKHGLGLDDRRTVVNRHHGQSSVRRLGLEFGPLRKVDAVVLELNVGKGESKPDGLCHAFNVKVGELDLGRRHGGIMSSIGFDS
mmetsp:Transcript_8937/g.14754  ORF Transcript_8937/g.14754 Transcript_8937/m.14754 type:complete len:202 (-) Transcript_8937:26-631(-)